MRATRAFRKAVENVTDNEDLREGRVAKAIEHQTAKIPSDVFLWTAVGSMVGSLALQAGRQRNLSLFVGQWAPTLLILGLYNKIVKIAGSDQMESAARA